MTTDKMAQSSETALPDSIQYTDRWTPGQTDRLAVVTSLFSTSLGLQMVKLLGADERQDHDIRSVGTAV
jgi:hypothetical protein